MIDLLILAVFVVLVVRGWRLGLVRQALDVLTLLVGALLAFRLSPLVGRLVGATFGWSVEPSRVVGGALLFLGLSIGAAVAAAAIHGSMRRLPGASLLNSVAGASLGAVYALILAIAALTLLAAFPLPAAVAAELDESAVATRVIDADGPAQKAIRAVSGDRAVQSIIWLRRLADDWLVTGEDDDVVLPAAGPGATRPSSGAAERLVTAVDAARTEAGLSPLEWSTDLDVVAVARANVIYRTGSFIAHEPIQQRLASSGIDAGAADERLVLAPTIESAAAAVDATGAFTRAGVGVVDGPYGMMVVLVLVG
jgi:uncharacterized membrane protein required for colicin V production